MTYTVYATLPDGRKLKYGKSLNTAAEVSAAMTEMKSDLKAARLTAKVGYVNNNPPKAVPKTPAVSKPAVSTAKNPGAGKIAGFDRAPYDPKKYVGYLRVARKYYPNAVIVVCYNEADVWGSRAEAKKFYMEGVYACEGAERDRYMNVVCDLEDGKDVALDTWDC